MGQCRSPVDMKGGRRVNCQAGQWLYELLWNGILFFLDICDWVCVTVCKKFTITFNLEFFTNLCITCIDFTFIRIFFLHYTVQYFYLLLPEELTLKCPGHSRNTSFWKVPATSSHCKQCDTGQHQGIVTTSVWGKGGRWEEKEREENGRMFTCWD